MDSGYLLSYAREELGEGIVDEALADAAIGDPRLEAFRSHNAAEDHACGAGPRPAKPTEEELAALASELETASDADGQYRRLTMFFQRPFPGDPARLVALIESRDERVARGAAAVLARPPTRRRERFATGLVKTRSPLRKFAIEMLNTNFASGDHELALAWCAAERNRDVLHSMIGDLIDMSAQHPEALSFVYEKSPCSFCRYRAVQRLIKLDVLPAQWREECAEDAFEETRDLVTAPESEEGQAE